MNAIENHGLEVIRKWEQESASGDHPMVFVSYSYDDDEHRRWVRLLRNKLRADGINAITDETLPNGYPLNLFMEQILTSPQLKFVICVCSSMYAQKADSGIGGVGYEQAIMARELTTTLGDNKVIPILRHNPEGHVPKFLGTKKYLDFRDDQKFNDAYSELVGDIFEIPRMPRLGRVLDYVGKKRLKAESFSNDSRKNKRSSQKNDERERIIKLVGRIPSNVLEVLTKAKKADGVILMVNAPISFMPRSLFVGNMKFDGESGDQIIAYLKRKGLVESIHKDWNKETFILTDQTHEFLDRAIRYRII